MIYHISHEKFQFFTANLPIFSFVPQFYLVKCYFLEFDYGHVPLRTTLRLITHKLLDLNFSKNKSDLTGLCRKMNNLILILWKMWKKIRVILSLVCVGWHLKGNSLFKKIFQLTQLRKSCWSRGTVLALQTEGREFVSWRKRKVVSSYLGQETISLKN